MEIHEKIKQTREDKDIKQKEIANYLKITQAGYSRYESGIVKITAETLKQICQFLNVSADEILELRTTNRAEVKERCNKLTIELINEISKI